MKQLLFLVALLCGLVNGVLVSEKIATREEIQKAGWVYSVAPPQETLRMTFALKIDRDLLDRTALDIALPNSPNYGKHLTREQLTALISPPTSTIEAVVKFLKQYGVETYELKSNNGYLYATMTAQTASEMFQTPLYRLYQKVEGKIVRFHSFDGLNLPDEVAAVVTYLGGIETRVPVIKAARFIANGQPMTGDTDVADLKQLYFIDPNYNATNGQKCAQAVGEFQYQWFDPQDTQQFFKEYSLNNVGRTVSKIVGTNNPSLAGAEASLDVEYMMAMGSNCSMTFYYIDDGNFINSLLDFFVDLNNETNPELVVSVSFGTDGDEPFSTVDQLDQECAKLGTRGVTVMFASGDNGVGCKNNKNEPDFPNSPHILMVGATDLSTGTEIGAKLSSGGFSDDYPIQSWQSDVVATFFTTAQAAGTLPPATQYNASGRGFPDVSAIGVNLPVIVRGSKADYSGTSFSSPIFGGILSLLNDIRATGGKTPLGWVNPLFYQIAKDNPSAFTDITTGPKNGDGNCQGFQPQKGWDPVTGLGSPNFQVLSKIINNY